MRIMRIMTIMIQITTLTIIIITLIIAGVLRHHLALQAADGREVDPDAGLEDDVCIYIYICTHICVYIYIYTHM